MPIKGSDRILRTAWMADAMRVHLGANVGDDLACDSPAPVCGDIYALGPNAPTIRLALTPTGQDGGICVEKAEGLAEPGTPVAIGDRLQMIAQGAGRVTITRLRLGTDPAAPILLIADGPLRQGAEYTLLAAQPATHLPAPQGVAQALARGTLVRLGDGTLKPVEEIEEGDRVLTRDRGAQPVRWIGRQVLPATGPAAPVMIEAGALGNSADLLVSPDTRLLMCDWRAEVMMGSSEVLVAAADMVNDTTIWRREGGVVDYIWLLFDRHEVIEADGVPVESMLLTAERFAALPPAERRRIMALFPNVVEMPRRADDAGRVALKPFEARTLLRQIGLR